MRLGAEANASGGRGGCVWERRRMRLGAEADADGAKFADKLGICIYEASGGALRVWFELHQACRPRLASESRLTSGVSASL